MSRLYGRLKSDRCKTDATVGANEGLSTFLTWGSAHKINQAMDVLMTWRKGINYPVLVVDIPDDVKVRMYRSGIFVFGCDPS